MDDLISEEEIIAELTDSDVASPYVPGGLSEEDALRILYKWSRQSRLLSAMSITAQKALKSFVRGRITALELWEALGQLAARSDILSDLASKIVNSQDPKYGYSFKVLPGYPRRAAWTLRKERIGPRRPTKKKAERKAVAEPSPPEPEPEPELETQFPYWPEAEPSEKAFW